MRLPQALYERRDDLALRKLRGEPLGHLERLTLAVLNMMVRVTLPRPEPLPKDVRKALGEAKRMLRR